MPAQKQFVDSQAVADYLGLGSDTELRQARCNKIGRFADLPYFKLGRRVKYDLVEVDRWVDRHRVGDRAA